MTFRNKAELEDLLGQKWPRDPLVKTQASCDRSGARHGAEDAHSHPRGIRCGQFVHSLIPWKIMSQRWECVAIFPPESFRDNAINSRIVYFNVTS